MDQEPGTIGILILYSQRQMPNAYGSARCRDPGLQDYGTVRYGRCWTGLVSNHSYSIMYHVEYCIVRVVLLLPHCYEKVTLAAG